MIPEPFQPWFAPKYALVRQIIYLRISNPGVIFFSDPAGKVWYVRQTKQTSLHLLAETPDVKNPRALALFSYDRFLVAVDRRCNKIKVVNNVYYEWKSVKFHHNISNVHLSNAISTQICYNSLRSGEISLSLLQADVNMLELSDGCLRSA